MARHHVKGSTMSSSSFEDLPDRYDLLIDWPKRLAYEGPFYRRLFAEHQVRSVLDAACGTGRHAEMFHSWGLRVEGADVSPEMIAHCRRRLGESDTLRWCQRSFTEPADPPGGFDAVICVGNSLALANDRAVMDQAVRAMLASVCSGGVCVIQVLNLWRLPEGETTWQKCKRVTLAGQDHVLLKGIHRVGERAFIDFVDLVISGDGLTSDFHQTSFAGVEAYDLADMARGGGATSIMLYGGYQGEAYDRHGSPDLILVCAR